MSLLIPSYKSGFARCAAESENPGLWDGLVGLWAPPLGPTGLTLFDWSGYRNHGTLTNGPTWVRSRLGYVLGYDRTAAQRVVVNPVNRFQNITQVSISLWLKSSNNADRAFIVSDGGWIVVQGNKTGGRLSAFFAGSGDEKVWTTGVFDGEWHHVVATNNGGTGKLYVDGQEADSGAAALNSAAANRLVGIGAHDNGSFPFDGQIGPTVYCIRALRSSEIQKLYRDSHALTRLRSRVFAAAVAPGGGPFPHYTRRRMTGGMVTMGT